MSAPRWRDVPEPVRAYALRVLAAARTPDCAAAPVDMALVREAIDAALAVLAREADDEERSER